MLTNDPSRYQGVDRTEIAERQVMQRTKLLASIVTVFGMIIATWLLSQ